MLSLVFAFKDSDIKANGSDTVQLYFRRERKVDVRFEVMNHIAFATRRRKTFAMFGFSIAGRYSATRYDLKAKFYRANFPFLSSFLKLREDRENVSVMKCNLLNYHF